MPGPALCTDAHHRHTWSMDAATLTCACLQATIVVQATQRKPSCSSLAEHLTTSSGKSMYHERCNVDKLHACRPSFVVRATQRNPFRSSLAEHLTSGYRKSLMAVCLAQLGSKAVPGGLQVCPVSPDLHVHDAWTC